MVRQELPTGWLETRLEDIASYIQRGKSPQYIEYSEIPVVNQKSIRWHGIEKEHLKYIHPEQWKSWSAERFLKNFDILWNSTGTGTIGRACLYKAADIPKAVVDTHVTIVRLFQNYTSPKYVFYYIMSPFVQKKIEDMQSGSTNQVELGRKAICDTIIPLAPLNEQRRIVSKIEELFSRVDDGAAALRRVQRLLTSYRQAVLKAAVTGELTKDWREANQHRLELGADLLQRILAEHRSKWETANPGKKYQLPAPPNTINVPTIPDSWCWARVKQVGVVQLGRQRAPQYHNGPNMRPYLRVANVYEDRIETGNILEMNFDPNEYERYKLEYGDILLNEGQSPEYLGRPAMYRNEVPGSCFQNTLIRFKAVDGLLPEYALCVFRHYMHSGRFRKLSQITTNIAHLSVGRFIEIEFPLPPMNEQVQIVEEIERRLSSINHLVAETKSGITRITSLRQSILKAAFSGQLVEQDPTDEPAGALLQCIQDTRQIPTSTQPKGTRPHKQATLWEPT